MPAVPYQIFMIHLPDNEVSQYYRKLTEESWRKFGYEVTPFEGTTPDTLGTEIPFRIKSNGGIGSLVREFTPTEKAVWYSHYRLWKKCVELDEPIIVIEHDSILVEDFDHSVLLKKNCGVLSGKPRMYGLNEEDSNDWIPTCGSGYFIRPKVAKDMADLYKFPIDCNSDGHIIRNMFNTIGRKHTYVHGHIRHHYEPEIGSTIDHCNANRKIII